MKRFFKMIILSFTIIFTISLVYKYNYKNNACIAADSHNIGNNVNTEDVTVQQLKAQIDLFKQTLEQYGATSPEQAVDLWAKGFEKRNGVLQYSVFCDKLKDKFIKERGEASESFWIIGGSSPWMERYEIVKSKKLSASSYEITVRLHWVAVGYNETEEKILTIVREKNKWCIGYIR